MFTKKEEEERPFSCEHNYFKLCRLCFVVKTCFGRPTQPLSDLENFLNVHIAEMSLKKLISAIRTFRKFQLKYVKITMNIVHRPTCKFVTYLLHGAESFLRS